MDELRIKRYKDKINYIIDNIKDLPTEPKNELEKRGIFYSLQTSIESTIDLIAMLVKELLEMKIEANRRQMWTSKLRFGGRANVVHQDMIEIDPSSFKILSREEHTNGDTTIEWEAVGHVKTSYYVSRLEPIRRSGTLLIKANGEAELL